MATKNAAPVEPERAYTYGEVAALLGVTPRQVQRWCEDGRMSFIKLPAGRRILARHYAAFIAEREQRV